MDYMGWQINNMKLPLAESIIQAMQCYSEKYGMVPNVVECSEDIPKDQLPRFEGVIFRLISVPTNILLLGVQISSSTNVTAVQ